MPRLTAIRKQRFVLGCSQEIFSDEEIELLERYGHWYRRLACGELRPETEAQRQFVEVAQGERQPETVHEKTWRKYRERLALESDPANRQAMGEIRRMPNDREDWKRMAGTQWSKMMRRTQGRSD